MKKLALLFVCLIGCVHPTVIPTPKEAIEVTVKNGMTFVDYRVSMATSERLATQSGQDLAVKLQLEAAKRARTACSMRAFIVSQSIKQENDELSGRIVVVCIPKEEQEQEQKEQEK